MRKKKNTKNTKKIHDKKILDGVDLINNKENVKDFDKVITEIRKDIIDEELLKGKNESKENIDINSKIQSVISIMFTFVIFVLILVLIFVLYNNYLKKNKDYDVEKICQDYIKEDYNIKDDDIINYIKNNRHIIYNISEFDINNIDNDTINEFSKYIIWNSDSEYSICSESEYCLDTKKEINYDELKEELINYFDLDSLNLIFDYNFIDSDITRLFIDNDKVILTFKGMEYETFKHDIVDINIDSDNIDIIFALSKRKNDDYIYIGSKRVGLKYKNSKFYIKSIKSNII